MSIMKKNKHSTATMGYYLWKFKGALVLAILPQLVVSGLSALGSLFSAEILQRAIEKDLRGFIIVMLALAGIWIATMGADALYKLMQSNAIRKMNNAFRKDMSMAILKMSYEEYHSKDTGEYLSRFTNDVNQIENMAWQPFKEKLRVYLKTYFLAGMCSGPLEGRVVSSIAQKKRVNRLSSQDII